MGLHYEEWDGNIHRGLMLMTVDLLEEYLPTPFSTSAANDTVIACQFNRDNNFWSWAHPRIEIKKEFYDAFVKHKDLKDDKGKMYPGVWYAVSIKGDGNG